MPIPECKNRGQIEDNLTKECKIIGRYSLVEKPTKKVDSSSRVTWSALVLEDGTEVLLESFWFRERERPKEEQKKFLGKLVQVTGTLNASPPLPEAQVQNIAMFCISPIKKIISKQS